jgi:hypothetical protein
MTEHARSEGSEESRQRIRVFANFFKSYMSVSTIVVAAIPIPVSAWKLIPLYAQQKQFLTVYSSLFCYLLLAFVFSIRHWLARRMFSGGVQGFVVAVLPLVCILGSLGCICEYHNLLQQSTEQLRSLGLMESTSELLQKMDSTEIPYGLPLAACYMGFFLFAEAAFVLMAIREYLQDVLQLDERQLLRGVDWRSKRALVKDEASVALHIEGTPPPR